MSSVASSSSTDVFVWPLITPSREPLTDEEKQAIEDGPGVGQQNWTDVEPESERQKTQRYIKAKIREAVLATDDNWMIQSFAIDFRFTLFVAERYARNIHEGNLSVIDRSRIPWSWESTFTLVRLPVLFRDRVRLESEGEKQLLREIRKNQPLHEMERVSLLTSIGLYNRFFLSNNGWWNSTITQRLFNWLSGELTWFDHRNKLHMITQRAKVEYVFNTLQEAPYSQMKQELLRFMSDTNLFHGLNRALGNEVRRRWGMEAKLNSMKKGNGGAYDMYLRMHNELSGGAGELPLQIHNTTRSGERVFPANVLRNMEQMLGVSIPFPVTSVQAQYETNVHDEVDKLLTQMAIRIVENIEGTTRQKRKDADASSSAPDSKRFRSLDEDED